ncbi:VirK/YbjX family protein [Arcobacter defluvii]|uniref:DUF535 domain-containing protein n=1 Tax=Arcobacter defluvii TaxID=873191 RepID=A0AAE7BI24_9BACT|nr:DUF535 family protein [Arcobacter defluvii]QKF78372.1 DUF535 domain-containing protein [Arcobacter defluvii]RXI30841.1 hypothetical protein CP964_11395 [Arcobacter defluvii]
MTTLFTILNILKLSFFKKMKFFSRAVFFTKEFESLFKTLNQDKLKSIIKLNPNIFLKPFRAYMFCNIKISEKFKFLESHYSFLNKYFSEKAINKIYKNLNNTLLEAIIDENYKIDVNLCYIGSLGKEGELTLLLKLNEEEIYSIQFSFYENSLIICGVQGRNTTNTEELKELTKKMHGVRPRNLMFFILRQICEVLNIRNIEAIGSRNHVANCSKVRNTNKFLANYDEYWEEEKANKEGDFYILSLIEQRKNMEEIPSKKRSMYKKRFEMLDNMKKNVKKNLLNLISL